MDKTGLTSEDLRRKFPNIQSKCYFLPSCHFNERSFATKSSKGDFYEIKEKPLISLSSKRRGDEAQQRVLLSLQRILEGACSEEPSFGPMFVINSYFFNSFAMNKHKKPTKGEVDILIIHKHLGIIIVEVKSVGDIEKPDHEGPDKAIETALGKIKDRYEEKLRWGRFVMKTLQMIKPVTIILAFPNLSRHDLKRIISSSHDLQEFFKKSFKAGGALQTRCICQDELPGKHRSQEPVALCLSDECMRRWWSGFASSLRIPSSMTNEEYEICIAAFVGPNSKITIWSPMDEKTERDIGLPGDSVFFTAKRYEKPVFYPCQQEIYSNSRSLQHLYMTGPPGCGKTFLLVRKICDWLEASRRYVVILKTSGDDVIQPKAYDIQKRVENLLEGTALNRLLLFSPESPEEPSDTVRKVEDLLRTRSMDRKSVCFILGDVRDDRSRALVRKLKETFREAVIWTAGPSLTDKPAAIKHFKIMDKCLQRPPAIQWILKETEKACDKMQTDFKYVLSSTEEDWPLPTDGPPVKWLSHFKHKPRLADCRTCGLELGKYLVDELHVGEDIGRMQFDDVLMVMPDVTKLQQGGGFLEGLKEAGVPVRVCSKGQKPRKECAIADISMMRGLERMIVVFLPDDLEHASADAGSSLHSPEHRRLQSLGQRNTKVLWHAMAACLAQGIIFHSVDEEPSSESRASSSCGGISSQGESAGHLVDNVGMKGRGKRKESRNRKLSSPVSGTSCSRADSSNSRGSKTPRVKQLTNGSPVLNGTPAMTSICDRFTYIQERLIYFFGAILMCIFLAIVAVALE